jgi:hypothetical protein
MTQKKKEGKVLKLNGPESHLAVAAADDSQTD